MVDFIWYLLAGVAAGVLVVFIYWYGRKRNWLGTIPIASTVIDPLIFSPEQRKLMDTRQGAGNWIADRQNAENTIAFLVILGLIPFMFIAWNILGSSENIGDAMINWIPYLIPLFAMLIGILLVVTIIHNRASGKPIFRWDSLLDATAKGKLSGIRREQTKETRWMEQDSSFILITMVILGSVFLGIVTLTTYFTNILTDPVDTVIILIVNGLILILTFMLWYYYWKRRGGVVQMDATMEESTIIAKRIKNLPAPERKMYNRISNSDNKSRTLDRANNRQLNQTKYALGKVYGKHGTGDDELNQEIRRTQTLVDRKIDRRRDEGTWK